MQTSTSRTNFTNIFASNILRNRISNRIFDLLHQTSRTNSRRSQQSFVRLFRLLHRFSLQHHEVKYSTLKHSSKQSLHRSVRISRLRQTKTHQNRWRSYQSIVRLLLRSRLLEIRFENIMNFTCKSHISLWMIWVACLLRSLNHLICDRIKIVLIFRKTSTFVNLRSRASQMLRKSLISLSKICSRCSMRNSEETVCFRVK